ncbi:MAG: hypothetical protein Q9191_003684, partial [Dirinaria sp. TL-2023a]
MAPASKGRPGEGRRPGKSYGGRFSDGSYKIGGLAVSADPDLDQLVNQSQPTPLFPPLNSDEKDYRPPSPTPLTGREKSQIAHFRAFRSKVHEGPYYTVLGDHNVRIDKAARTAAANRDPFEAMPTYSKKYTKNRQRLPRMMNHRTYVLKFFPKELWSVLDRKAAKANNNGLLAGGTENGRKLKPAARRKQLDGEKEVMADAEEAEKSVHEFSNDEEDAMDNLDLDDEFEDDDDGGGDYNAEAYFDDGGDDFGEEYD